MGRHAHRSRRHVLRFGGALGGFLLAGCLADDGASERDDGAADDTEESDADGENDDVDDDGGDENGGASGSNDESADAGESGDDESVKSEEAENWDAVDEIVLSADTSGWEGVDPPMIEGEANPTIVLAAGEEYTLTWKNADGVPHNIEIWDDEERVVDGYESELMESEGETQSLVFEASREMAEYICEVHADWAKRGEIVVEPTDS